ncbi:ANTAR domain-containing protein [Nocardioides sp. zg-1228]|uniref:ANTAR domain-containing protein n=1 Tax=Nocardioides sp. zg-1228 TaxID=2763008 RepID=UPI0016429DC8|nr:ANTAR domain-containing protein [Nocardioides sp. zg-1228]MBC2933963.1 ANTAR domain-containing protein [Nocardioides sp. zg-1228]QSF58722.1 ANTAR domain-containing protein [Nocardioides sp. zg-1228]
MSQVEPPRIAALLAQAATSITAARTTHDMVEAIVAAAPDAVPGFDHASVTIRGKDGQNETYAASSNVVEKLDLIQYDCGEGPCLDALVDGGTVISDHMRHEHRWPSFVPRALEAGVTAQMGIGLHEVDSAGGAVLNLCSTTGDGIGPESRDLAQLFALYAATALGGRHNEEHLTTALSSRKVIGQAVGILMERYRINESNAFDYLVRVSSTANIKLRDVAAEVVTQSDTRYTTDPPH